MLQLKHINFKFSYLFLIRKPLQLHKSSLFQIDIDNLSPDPENIHLSGIPLIHCWLVRVFARLWSLCTIYSYVPHLWTNSTSEVSNTLFCHVPPYSLNFSKTHLHMWIHRQVWCQEEARKRKHINLEPSKERERCTMGHVILKINTNTEHWGCFLQNYFHESWPCFQHLTHKDLEVPINKVRREETSSMSVRSRYHLKYDIWVEVNRKLH